ncbi:uncharacterized protein LOC127278511 [Leptopilina boulardi]|uniref:uncharacterized protein LOC127278511 n=1 Tax=Leptopilina boulardi TaxID=63433 RepID=UPI0021F6332D|nr:uncharacterized protein LOC127278511 [Leptopilina boulardi]
MPVLREEDPYNLPFSRDELNWAINLCKKDSAPGKDQIPNIIFRKLPLSSLEELRDILNVCFRFSIFPDSWTESLVKFIPKPGGKGYRPISLTSSVGKLMERLIQKRLDHHVEFNRLIPPHQFGFRKNRSVTDCVSVLVVDVLKGFTLGQGTAALALDLKGAFNALLPSKILDHLARCGTPTRLRNFVAHMVCRRNISFKEDDLRTYECGVGVPQGGVLSPLLFNLALRDICSRLPPGVRILQYADDILLYCRYTSATDALNLLAQAVRSLSPWLLEAGLNFSPSKSQLCLFDRRSLVDQHLRLELEGQEIPIVDSIMYLGILLDSKLSWKLHVEYIAAKAFKAINVLKVLGGVSKGANPETLLLIYKGLIRAHLEWGSILFAGASKSTLAKLDKAQYRALRSALGFMRSTPIPIVLSEANEPPLHLRRHLALHRNAIRICSWSDNPTAKRLAHLDLKSKNQRNFPKYASTLPLLVHLRPTYDIFDTPKKPRRPGYYNQVWSDLMFELSPLIDLKEGFNIRRSKSHQTSLNDFLQARYPNFTSIFTDGSYKLSNDEAGASFFVPGLNFRHGTKVRGCFSSTSVELFAIFQACKYVRDYNINKSIICTDSLGSLSALKDRVANFSLDPIIHDIVNIIINITKKGQLINFLWVPAHLDLEGNTEADRLAKMAASLDISNAPFTGYLSHPSMEEIKNLIEKDHQASFNIQWPFFDPRRCSQIYFEYVNHKVDRPWFRSFDLPRNYINLVSRLRSGHICVGAHFLRMNWNIPPPHCSCGEGIGSIPHLLNHCILLNPGRPNFINFVRKKFNDISNLEAKLTALIFHPDLESVSELGDFFIGRGVLI